MNVTLGAIAQKAGVSISTVSRVVNDSAYVSEEKIRQVREAASTLGSPITSSRRTSTRLRTQNIALIYAGWDPMELNEWGFVNGFEEVFSQNNLRLILVQMSGDGNLPRVLLQKDCDGIVILSNLREVSESQVAMLEKFPCIQMIQNNTSQAFGDEFFCDNYLISKLAFEHLTSIGVKKPAFYNVLPEHRACLERGQHFKFITEQAGGEVAMLVVDLKKALTKSNYLLAEDLVEQMVTMEDCPDGIFVPVDYQLPELYAALRQCGIQPMKDIQIVSCDNSERHLIKAEPRPVTMDLHWRDLARHAARQLIWRIENPDNPPVRLIIKPKVVHP
jgi:LacI family transcriptional regulator